MHFDLVDFLKTAGYLGIFAFIFAESGLLIGFFLPGDSLIFTAGILASQGFFNLTFLLFGTFFFAVSGDSVGYAFGKKVGPAIFTKEDSWLFKKDNLEKAKIFYEKHGGKTIVLARFMPVIRTFAPILAGVGRMKYSTFLAYNVAGGFLWTIGLGLLGYFLGNTIPDVDKYLLPIVLVIIFLSVAPGIWHIIGDKESRAKLLRLIFNKKSD